MRKKRTIISGCVLVWFLCQQIVFGKIFDESQAVRYEEYAASHTIEESTLFIGTYLIHVQALTEELYEKATESASDANQMNVYYKSELASGAWMDITDAGGLSDISGQGTVVEETELADLWVTCITGSDGITRDARDGHTVNIFSEPSPYDLYNLSELEPLKIQYSDVFSPESTGVDRYYFDKLGDFFALDLRNEITEACDVQMLGLQSCYESLRASKQDELAEIISKLMSRVDARRRAEIFSRLAEIDGNELSILQDICSGSQYSDGSKRYDKKQFVENAGVIDAIGLSIQNCQESYIQYSGNMLEEGSTILKQAEYEKSMAIVEMAAGGYSSAMESLLLELKHLYNLQEDVVADADAELLLLNGELLNQADLKYAQKLSEGALGAYQTAVANNASQAVKNQVLDDQKAEADAARLELQYLIQAKTKRQSAGDGAAFTYQRIEYADGLYGQVAADDFQAKANESIDAHILWLKELARSLEESDEELSSEMLKLEQKKTKLLEEQTQALDNNDLSTVKKYETMIAEVDRQIEAAEREVSAVLNSSTSSAADRARAANQAGSSSVLNQIEQTKDAALSAIAEGNLDDSDSIADKIDALSALGAERAIQEIREKLEASGTDQKELLAKADQAMEESKASSLHAQYGGTGSSTGEAGESGSSSGAGSGSGNEGGSQTSSGSAENVGGSADGAGTQGTESGDETAADQTAGESGDEHTDGSEDRSDGTDGTTGTEGEGASAAAALEAAELENLIESVMDQEFEDLNSSEKAAVIAALHRIGQSGNSAATSMARSRLSEGVREGNPWLYRKLKGESEEYLPLNLIASGTGYRYVFNNSKTEVTLSKKRNIYRFTVNREEVILQDGATEKLHALVKVQNEIPYLSKTDASKYFSCEAEYIENTEYGIFLGPKAQAQIEAIVSAAEEGV